MKINKCGRKVNLVSCEAVSLAASEGSLPMMVTGGLDDKQRHRGNDGGGRRNLRARKMGEGPGVLLERGLGGAGGYDFQGDGGGRWSLCGEGYRVGYGRTRW